MQRFLAFAAALLAISLGPLKTFAANPSSAEVQLARNRLTCSVPATWKVIRRIGTSTSDDAGFVWLIPHRVSRGTSQSANAILRISPLDDPSLRLDAEQLRAFLPRNLMDGGALLNDITVSGNAWRTFAWFKATTGARGYYGLDAISISTGTAERKPCIARFRLTFPVMGSPDDDRAKIIEQTNELLASLALDGHAYRGGILGDRHGMICWYRTAGARDSIDSPRQHRLAICVDPRAVNQWIQDRVPESGRPPIEAASKAEIGDIIAATAATLSEDVPDNPEQKWDRVVIRHYTGPRTSASGQSSD